MRVVVGWVSGRFMGGRFGWAYGDYRSCSLRSMGQSSLSRHPHYGSNRGPQVKGLLGTIEKQIKAVKHIPPDYDKSTRLE